MKTKRRTFLLGALVLGSVAATSQAAVLLQIDITDSSSVRFYATEKVSSIDVALMRSDNGFTLMDFFTSTASRTIISVSSSSLTAPTWPMNGSYNQAVPSDYTASYSAGRHLTVFQSPNSLQQFLSGQRAFSGDMTINLSQFTSLFPTGGTTGEIRPGNGFSQAPSIGQFQIIARTVVITGDVTPTPGPGNWNVGGPLTIGNTGTGGMQIKDAIKVSSSAGYLGATTGSSGTAEVSGAGSQWAVSTDLFVGQGGTGNLTVSAGGSVSNINGHIGANAGSTGTALVTGVGSTWANTGALHVGENGTGTLTVAAGGAVSVTGALTVHGAGDNLTLDGGTVTAGGGVHVLAGAAIGGEGTINGDLDFASGAKFVFDSNKTLTVNGLVSMDSSFGIASLLGLDASVAEGSYTLIDGTTTDFSSFGLQNWGYANRYRLSADGDPYKAAYFEQGSLVVTVVPEPASAALLLGLFATGTLLCRRRARSGRTLVRLQGA